MSTPARKRVNADTRSQPRAIVQAAPTAAPPFESPAPAIRLPLQDLLTIEVAAYLAVFILGLAIRIGHLGAYPLDLEEATRAFSGWQLVRGGIPISWQDPLVVSSAALSILTLGDNDVTVRVIPALLGSALVALPWLIRTQIGRLSALLASLFLAISPTFVFYSRTLSGEAFAATLSLGLLVCLVRYIVERKPRWAIAGGVLVGLLLNSGAPGVSFLLPFVAFFALVAAFGKRSNEYTQAWENLKVDRETLKQTGIGLVGVFVLVGSGFLGNLSGLLLPGLSAWVDQFNLVPNGRPWYFHFALLLGYEPLIFLFGVAAAVYYVYRWQTPQTRRPLGVKSFLIIWAVVSLAAAAFAGSKDGGQLLGPLLPLALLAGCLAGDLLEGVDNRLTGTVRILLASSLPFLVYALLLISDLTQKDRLVFWYQWVLVVLALALVAGLILAAFAHGGRHVGRVVVIGGLVLLIGYSVHIMWQTAYFASETAVFVPSLTSPSLVDAINEIGELATSRFLGTSVTVAVEPSLKLPAAWYLRRYPAIKFTNTPPPGTQAILWTDGQPPDVNLEDYFTRRATVVVSQSGGRGSLGELWRWLMLKEPFGTTQSTDMMLYLHK